MIHNMEQNEFEMNTPFNRIYVNFGGFVECLREYHLIASWKHINNE